MITFQEMIRKLNHYWEEQGCIVHQSYDLEVGAGTMNPATFLRSLGPEPYRAAYVEACRRPTDGRYGQNPNRMQHYFQYQVILKPSPFEMQELYLGSLRAIGFDLTKHDVRFVHDDWENPTIGAWGLGWEVWMDGMEITQYTYFQSVGGMPVDLVTGELTYGLERLAMYLQDVERVFDLQWNNSLTYGDIYHRNEVEWSHYNFEEATTEMWYSHFIDFENEAKKLIEKRLALPAYEFVMKSSHAFNILDARGAISVTERTGYIGRIRNLARGVAQAYIETRKELGLPLSSRFPPLEYPPLHTEPLSPELLLIEPSQKGTFLLEIGSEELPATFVPIGLSHLKRLVEQLFKEEGITYDSLAIYGTPRRLAVVVEGIAYGVLPQSEEKRGPLLERVFDCKGELTDIGKGFFRSNHLPEISLDEVRSSASPELQIKQVKGVDYLFVTHHTPGRTTAEILQQHLAKLILSIEFPKKMRWADLEISYARPISWVVALLDHYTIPFCLGVVQSGSSSRGHRQLCDTSFTISHAENYLQVLKEHKVMADLDERKGAIVQALSEIECKRGCDVVRSASVIPQVLNLVEWPTLVVAEFCESYLKAPKEVLISEMVDHQKYFPVANKDGSLRNEFIITADTAPSEKICHGNQRVLSSRLSDGVFLYEKGRETPLETCLEKLKQVTYMQGLGSMYDKRERMIKHIALLQSHLQISTEELAQRAAELSKADLVTEMVFEFPELQGTIGKYYASAHGEDAEVAAAIEEQWMPRREGEALPSTPTGILLALADKWDNILSCFAMGHKPTSSSDPHALRRQAFGIIKMVLRGAFALPFAETIKKLYSHFPVNPLKDQPTLVEEISSFFQNRVKSLFQDEGLTPDEIEAVMATGFDDLYDAYCKVRALHDFRLSNNGTFTALIEVFKRAKGQLEPNRHYAFSDTLLSAEAELLLAKLLEETHKPFVCSLEAKEYERAYTLMTKLQPALARLFDEVHILDKDPIIRENRLGLLQRVFERFFLLLDLGKIQEK